MLNKTSAVRSQTYTLSSITSATHDPTSPYSPSDSRNLLNLPGVLLNIIHGQLAPVDAIHFQQLCMAGNRYLHTSINNPISRPGELRNYSVEDSDKASIMKSSLQENVKLQDDLARCYTVDFDKVPKRNKLKSFMQKLSTLTHLTTVTINCTMLKPEHILTLLETLTSLPIVDISLSNIKYHSNLGMIFVVLGRFPQLSKLTLDQYEAIILPQTLCQLTRLESLYIQSDILKRFPANINQLTNLVDLSIKARNLQDLPNLPALPATLGLLPNLHFLEIFTNTVIIPPAINRLVQLEELGLDIESLLAVPPVYALGNLRILHLLCPQLTTFPVEICKLETLQTLQIRSKNLTRLPAEISQLTQLDILIVSAPIKKIPSEIGHLTALQTLHLYGNFESLPASFGNLSNLVFMNIQSPRLNSLPDWIDNLRQLQMLDILLPHERFSLPVFSTLQQSLAVLGMVSHSSNLRGSVAKLEQLTTIRFFIKNHINMIMRIVKPAEIDLHSWLEYRQINIVHALYLECTHLTEQEIQLILSVVFSLAPTLSTLSLLNMSTDIPEHFMNTLPRPNTLKLAYRFAEEPNLALAAAE